MTGIVVEVGPATIRGPNHADAEWVSAGIDGIDDELTLIDDRPVDVADVWRTVMHDVVGGSAETIVVVCPTWWASSRVDRVRDAASTVANDVVVLRRAQVLRDGLSDRPLTVVEIAPEFVVVSSPGGDIQVVARGDAEAVLAKIPTSMAVVVDGPEGVEGACPLAAVIADRLRANGVAVTIAIEIGCDAVSRHDCRQDEAARLRLVRRPIAADAQLPYWPARWYRLPCSAVDSQRETTLHPSAAEHADDAVGRGACRCHGASAMGGPARYVGTWIGTGAGRFAE